MRNKTTINESLLRDIIEIYSDAEAQLLENVAKRAAKGVTEVGWNENELVEVQELNQKLSKILNDSTKLSKAKLSKGIIDSYVKGVKDVIRQASGHASILSSQELNIPIALQTMIIEAHNLLDSAQFQVLRNAQDAYRAITANASTGLLSGVDDKQRAIQKMLNESADRGITHFTDRAGRVWDLSSYAEMSIRTSTMNAYLQGHIDTQIELGEDLVQISSVGTTCPLCAPWQGVVLSISGKSTKYRSLDSAKSAGLFHPNCIHDLLLYDEEMDGEGQSEPKKLTGNERELKRNAVQEQQRSNERQIRKWKKRKAVSISDDQTAMCDRKIKEWQAVQRKLCAENNVPRLYYREGNKIGKVGGKTGTKIL